MVARIHSRWVAAPLHPNGRSTPIWRVVSGRRLRRRHSSQHFQVGAIRGVCGVDGLCSRKGIGKGNNRMRYCTVGQCVLQRRYSTHTRYLLGMAPHWIQYNTHRMIKVLRGKDHRIRYCTSWDRVCFVVHGTLCNTVVDNSYCVGLFVVGVQSFQVTVTLYHVAKQKRTILRANSFPWGNVTAYSRAEIG